jgi:ribulose-phosphate 3-epimerase
MKAYASLWSADLLALGEAVDRLDGWVDGYHIDIMDGVCVPDLLFGLDFVSALRQRTRTALDLHLMLSDTDAWIDRYLEAGSDLIAVHRQFCRDVSGTLKKIRSGGASPGLVVEIGDPLSEKGLCLEIVDRLLVMGTEIGVKGRGLHPETTRRIAALAELCARVDRHVEIVVDGGIRRQTVPLLAQSGADAVVPGSLVFKDPDPRAVLRWIRELRTNRPATGYRHGPPCSSNERRGQCPGDQRTAAFAKKEGAVVF